MASVVDEAWKSVRLTWGAEAWLPVGLPIAAAAYAGWVAATGYAVRILADATGIGLAMDPWTLSTDAIVAGLAVVWLLLPAALSAWLVRDRLTTDRGSIVVGYRLQHPLLLLVPPAFLLGAGLVALDRVGAAAWVAGLLVAGAAWLAVRTVAYTYRVFALSWPPVAHTITFLTAMAVGTAIIVFGATAVGVGEFLGAVAAGLEARTGLSVPGVVVRGTVDVRGARIPAVLALAVGLPVGLSSSYVGVQLVAGQIARLLKPTVRRPELRAGQRYPAFARPTTDLATTSTDSEGDWSSGADAAEPTEASPESAGPAEQAPEESGASPAEPAAETQDDLSYDLRNTRVYRPSGDAATVNPEPAAMADGSPQCPACGTELHDDGTCPNCESSER